MHICPTVSLAAVIGDCLWELLGMCSRSVTHRTHVHCLPWLQSCRLDSLGEGRIYRGPKVGTRAEMTLVSAAGASVVTASCIARFSLSRW